MKLSPFLRIGARYLAGYFAAKGVVSMALAEELASDPEVLTAIGSAVDVLVGVVIAVATEGFYWLAKKMGWST